MKRIFALAIGILAGLAIFMGCSAGQSAFEEKTYTADPSVTELRLEVKDRKFIVEPSTDGRLHLAYYENSKEFYEVASDGKMLNMTLRSDKGWTDYIGASAPIEYRTIRLKLPESGLASLSLETSNEDLSIPALRLSNGISVRVNNGDIRFERLQVGNAITLEAKNGSVIGTIAGGYDDFAIHSAVKKGESSLPETKEDGEKSLSVTVNHGDIDIDFVKVPES